jgi:hypothetical protein
MFPFRVFILKPSLFFSVFDFYPIDTEVVNKNWQIIIRDWQINKTVIKGLMFKYQWWLLCKLLSIYNLIMLKILIKRGSYRTILSSFAPLDFSNALKSSGPE